MTSGISKPNGSEVLVSWTPNTHPDIGLEATGPDGIALLAPSEARQIADTLYRQADRAERHESRTGTEGQVRAQLDAAIDSPGNL